MKFAHVFYFSKTYLLENLSERKRRRHREEDLPSTGSLFQMPATGRAGPGQPRARNATLVSHIGSVDPSTRVIICPFPGTLAEAGWEVKQTGLKSLHMERGHSKQWLTPLIHSACHITLVLSSGFNS